MIPFILLFVGLLIIYAEFFLPGGIFAVIGALMILGSIYLFAYQSDSVYWSVLFGLMALFLVSRVILFALKRITSSGAKSGLYSILDQEGYSASTYDKSAIGKKGVVSSDLKPGGKVLIEGKVHLALSKSGYIPKGEPVEVIGGEGECLIVKSITKEVSS